MTMFKPAVNKHNVSNAPISQIGRFNSISSLTTQAQDILKPSPPSSLNGPQTSIYSSEKNPLKRTASEAHQDVKPAKRSLGKTSSMGVLNHLHDDLLFDENDFDDTIDLEEEHVLPIKYPTLPTESSNPLNGASQQSVRYPDLPKSSTTSPTKPTPSKFASSAPLPWSSSPPTHKLPPQHATKLNSRKAEVGVVDLTEDSPPRPVKRRNLPWNEAKPAATPQTPQGSAPVMPSPPPWNKSASAIKKDQTALRQKNAQSKKAAAKQGSSDAKLTSKGKRGKGKMARVFLSDEQKMVLELVAEKKQSVFFTGSAGTGKSVLMREIIKVLRMKYAKEPDRVAVTASTGLAACNVSGVTLHSFAGIGLGKETAEELIKKIKKNSKARNRWLRAKVLIIDEISMVDGKLFDKLEKIARGLRNDGRPFGGIQLVVTGDFFQLPPVPDGGQEATFAFDAGTWRTVMQHTIGLTQVFRQKDPVFANMLNEMRIGKLSQNSINTFHKLHRQLDFEDSIEATELFPTRDEVDRSNRTRMQQLHGNAFVFDAMDGGTIQDTTQRDKLLNNCLAPQQITLKKGAQVMLIKNLDDGLVNGSIGKVIAFMDERTYDLYLEDEDSFQSADVLGMDQDQLQASRSKIRDHATKEGVPSNSKAWPLVNFQLQDGTSRQLLCVQEKWTIELPNGEVQASRSQIPLILAWALSIHKAQGQTLERVKVDLGKVFEKGQAYVALSRATSQEGLQVLNFNPKKVMAHEKVRKFYDGLYNIQDINPGVAKAGGMNPSTRATTDWLGDGFDDSSILEYSNYA